MYMYMYINIYIYMYLYTSVQTELARVSEEVGFKML